MTIRVTIKNEDSRENAIVVVKTLNKGVKSLLPIANPGSELMGGESKELYVHDGQSVIIEEVKNG